MGDDRVAAPAALAAGGDISRPAQAQFLFFIMQHRHGRFGAQSFDVPVQVFIEHQIADEHDTAGGKILHKLN